LDLPQGLIIHNAIGWYFLFDLFADILAPIFLKRAQHIPDFILEPLCGELPAQHTQNLGDVRVEPISHDLTERLQRVQPPIINIGIGVIETISLTQNQRRQQNPNFPLRLLFLLSPKKKSYERIDQLKTPLQRNKIIGMGHLGLPLKKLHQKRVKRQQRRVHPTVPLNSHFYTPVQNSARNSAGIIKLPESVRIFALFRIVCENIICLHLGQARAWFYSEFVHNCGLWDRLWRHSI
jgi:hypothetical protein